MSVKDWKRNFDLFKQKIPKAVGMIAVSVFKGNFVKQGFDGKKWKDVQRRIPTTKTYRYASDAQRTKAILSGKTGRLMNGIHIASISADKVVISTDKNISYAQYHNEGTKKIPKRQFMGNSKELNQKIQKLIANELKKVFK